MRYNKIPVTPDLMSEVAPAGRTSKYALIQSGAWVFLFCSVSAAGQVAIGDLAERTGSASPVPAGLVIVIVGASQLLHLLLWFSASALFVAGARFTMVGVQELNLRMAFILTAEAHVPLAIWAVVTLVTVLVYHRSAGGDIGASSLARLIDSVALTRLIAYLIAYFYTLVLIKRIHHSVGWLRAVGVTAPAMAFVALFALAGMVLSVGAS